MRRRDMRLPELAAVATAAVLTAAGCGGGAPARTGSTTASTTVAAGALAGTDKTLFIAQADAVCQDGRTSLGKLQAQTRALVAQGDTPKGFAAAAVLSRRVHALQQDELRRLRALKPPPGDSAAVGSYLQAATRAVALVGPLADAFARGDRAGLSRLIAQGGRVSATAKGLAQAYGFKVCGRGVGGNGLT